MAGGSSFFEGRRAVLLTKPTLEKATGCQIIVEAGFDTDQFGTFTREISRPGSQLGERCGFAKEKRMPRSKRAPAGRCQYCNP